jgi:predicted transcriptional regulator
MATTVNLSVKERRRRLDYAALVAKVASEAPDAETKRIVYTAVRIIEERFGFSREEKKKVLLRLITVGAASIAEIERESNFRRNDIHLLVAELVKEGSVTERWLNGRGDRGRPAVRYFPVEN